MFNTNRFTVFFLININTRKFCVQANVNLKICPKISENERFCHVNPRWKLVKRMRTNKSLNKWSIRSADWLIRQTLIFIGDIEYLNSLSSMHDEVYRICWVCSYFKNVSYHKHLWIIYLFPNTRVHSNWSDISILFIVWLIGCTI